MANEGMKTYSIFSYQKNAKQTVLVDYPLVEHMPLCKVPGLSAQHHKTNKQAKMY